MGHSNTCARQHNYIWKYNQISSKGVLTEKLLYETNQI